MFPSSLQDFQENRNSSPYAAKLGHYTGLAMEVVNPVEECRLPRLLPISMYYCAVMRLEHGRGGDCASRKIDLDWPEKRAIILSKCALYGEADAIITDAVRASQLSQEIPDIADPDDNWHGWKP